MQTATAATRACFDPVALLVLHDGWIDQLSVDPTWTGHGLGSVLINVAKEQTPTGSTLWTFESNRGARTSFEEVDAPEQHSLERSRTRRV